MHPHIEDSPRAMPKRCAVVAWVSCIIDRKAYGDTNDFHSASRWVV